jgi:hypothetical protein
MQVQVVHRLSALGSRVDDGSIPSFRYAFVARETSREEKDLAQQGSVALVRRVQRREMLAWYDEDMHRCFRIDVAKRNEPLARVDDRGRNLSRDDPAEDAV